MIELVGEVVVEGEVGVMPTTMPAPEVITPRLSFATSATYCSKVQLTMLITAITQLMSVVWMSNMQLGWSWMQQQQMMLNLSLIVNK